MRLIIVVIVLTVVFDDVRAENATAAIVSTKTLPEIFLGTFELERDEDFDEYLTAKGYGWFMRKMIKLASVTKVFRKAASKKPNRYDMENLTSKRNTLFADWALDEEFINWALDGKKHKITFTLNDQGDILTEKHIKVDEPNEIDTYEYYRLGDYLVMKMSHKDVTTRRYYKKQ